MARLAMALLLAATASSAAAAASVPLPSPAQLAYQQAEIIALTHFNMATYFGDGDPACNVANWAQSQKPSSFNPTHLNVSNWIESYKAVGAKRASKTPESTEQTLHSCRATFP